MPKKTIETILESGNDYVIQVKGNCSKLFADVKKHVKETCFDEEFTTKEPNRGRKENRRIQVYEGIPGAMIGTWKGINTVIVVRRWGIRDNKKYDEYHYYISNKIGTSAEVYAAGIRGHWFIENKLHWVKDKILNEDGSLVKGKDIAGNLSLIRTMVMNIFKLNKEMSITHAFEKYTNKLDLCSDLLEIKHI